MSADYQHIRFRNQEFTHCGIKADEAVPFLTRGVCPACVNATVLHADYLAGVIRDAEEFQRDLAETLDANPDGLIITLRGDEVHYMPVSEVQP